MSQQDSVGVKAEKYISLINQMVPPPTCYVQHDFYIHQAIMLGYRLAIGELNDFMNR